MKFQPLKAIFLILILCGLAAAQTVTLDEFLTLAKQNHPFFIKEAISSEIEKKVQERYLGAEDWVASASPYVAHQIPISTGPFSPERIDILGLGGSVERSLWKTGGRLSFSWSSQFWDQKIPSIEFMGISIPGGPARFAQHKISAVYSHPLMQNRGGKLDRLEYELSEYNIDFAKLQAEENQEGFLLDLGARFLGWVLLTQQREIAKERLHIAEEQVEQVKRKRAAFLVDEVDVIRSEDPVRIAKQNIVLIEAQWKAKQAELAVLAQSPEIYNQAPEFDLYREQSLPPIEDAVSDLKEQSRLLKALTTRQEQLAYQRTGLVELTRPQLYLNLGAALQEGDDVFGKSLLLDKPDLSVSVQFQYPLGNRTAKADIETMDLQLRQLEEEIKSISLELESGVRNLVIQIEEFKKVLALNREQIESAKQKTEEELRLYNQGRGQLTFVTQSRDNEENAKLTYAQNAALYQKLILQYQALVDQLLPSEFGGSE